MCKYLLSKRSQTELSTFLLCWNKTWLSLGSSQGLGVRQVFYSKKSSL